jgi:hypothetical protein
MEVGAPVGWPLGLVDGSEVGLAVGVADGNDEGTFTT